MASLSTSSRPALISGRKGRAAAIATLCGAMLGLEGCKSSPPAPSVPNSTSVPALEAALPNLSGYGIQSCVYASDRRQVGGGLVPAPSDTLLELAGQATLSDAGAAKLKAGAEWQPQQRDRVPAALLAVVPEGQLLTSRAVNRSFSQNKTYANGLLVVVSGDWSRVYFLARDLDHPVE